MIKWYAVRSDSKGGYALEESHHPPKFWTYVNGATIQPNGGAVYDLVVDGDGHLRAKFRKEKA